MSSVLLFDALYVHVGWWSPTIIRGDDREAIHIPNHKFTVNVVRNLTQKTHWRIKTHLAISHVDVNKINNIVADMRKVLAKNPQVEQQRLHRRVFLENVDRENQALLEAISLDLLRVISHHRARLATPIRTVQKIYRDGDIDDVPYSDIFTNNRAAANRPFLLIEPSYKVNGEDKNKSTSRPTSNPEKKDSKPVTPVAATSDPVADPNPRLTPVTASDPVVDPNPKLTPEVRTSNVGPTGSSSASSSSSANTKLEGEKPLTQRSALDDNIVLGVALEGSKRMLPIEDDEMGPISSPTGPESKEMASCLNGSGGSTTSNNKDQKDDKASLGSGSTQSEQREQEKR